MYRLLLVLLLLTSAGLCKSLEGQVRDHVFAGRYQQALAVLDHCPSTAETRVWRYVCLAELVHHAAPPTPAHAPFESVVFASNDSIPEELADLVVRPLEPGQLNRRAISTRFSSSS